MFLRKSGFTSDIRYTANDQQQPEKVRARSRRRKITSFNPPYSKNVKTNVGKKFLSLVERHFQAGSKLRKIFNRKTIKVSYSCMPNIGSVIKHHNANVLKLDSAQSPKRQEMTCNCRKSEQGLLEGDCLASNVVYKAIVTTDDCQKEYIGSTELPFKQRYYNHTTTLKHEHRQNTTELSKYVWQLKRRKEEFHIDWVILHESERLQQRRQALQPVPYRKAVPDQCGQKNHVEQEIRASRKFRHKNKFYLCNFASPAIT